MLTGFIVWRNTKAETRALLRRIARLPFHTKLAQAGLARDKRIPSRLRIVPPLLVLYLAVPIDIVPDFIPVLRQLDDILIVIAAAVILLRFTPPEFEEHFSRLESPATS